MLGALQAKKLGQEIPGPRRAQIFRPAQRLGETAFQQRGETIGESGAIVHQLATMFVEQLQLVRLDIVGHPGTKALGMLAQELQQELASTGSFLPPLG